MQSELTQDTLKEEIRYNPDTGVFTWLKKRPGRFMEKPAGSWTRGDYVRIRLFGTLYLAHQLAWLYMTGSFPTVHIDHSNMDRQDNRWTNLRLASKAENMRNTGLRKDNRSGYKGVSFYRQTGQWQAHTTFNGKQVALGFFDNKESAAEAFQKFASENYGEFMNLGTKTAIGG